MALHGNALGNNNYQPQFFLSLNTDKMEKLLAQKKHYEEEKNRCEEWLSDIRARFDKLRNTQMLVYDRYLVYATECCTLESNKKPIPPDLAAKFKQSRELLEDTTARLEKAYSSRSSELTENEEYLKSIEAELVAINKDIARAQRSAISLVTEDELVGSFLAKMGC